MSFLAEIAIAVVAALLHATIVLAQLAWTPVRFLIDRTFRATILKTRRTTPARFYLQMIGGSTVLGAFIVVLATSAYFLSSPKSDETEARELDSRAAKWLEKQIIERQPHRE